jgi:hypothetical protein
VKETFSGEVPRRGPAERFGGEPSRRFVEEGVEERRRGRRRGTASRKGVEERRRGGAMYLMMLGAEQPVPGEGELWRAIDGEPAYRRIAHTEELPSAASAAEVWIGRLRYPSRGDAPPVAEAKGLLVFSQEPRPGDEDEFDDWMDTEHVPALAGVTGTLLAQRYEAVVGAPRFTAIYYLTDPAVCTSEEWRTASRTPWRERMSARNLNRRRGLYVPAE